MITASIVTYNNNLLDLEGILRSLLISPVQMVWVIDHSDDFMGLEGELQEYKRRDDEFLKHEGRGFQLEYIKEVNKGYGGGHNVALRKAMEMGSKYHLVVNPDVWFGAEVIPALWRLMEEDCSIALVMPKVLFLNGSVQCLAKLLPTPVDLFCRFFMPGKLIAKRNDRFELKHSGYDKEMNVPFLSGCFMFLRISALQSEGIFDERFFMYMEDVDITRRLHAKYKTLFFPSVSIYHRFSRLSYHNWSISLIHMISVVKYFNKWGWIYDSGRRCFNKKLLKELKTDSEE
ncbi:MAG: glycosyltransferase family 2 protein [Bacteroidaceae bacterium]|nr:glycosyltransferase family 2 protein [Bacteroidaceae bacterium]